MYMASIFIIKSKMVDPKEWYDKEMGNDIPWNYDERLKAYRAGEICLSVKNKGVCFEDLSQTEFFGWDTNSWIELSQGNELLYGYYDDDNLEAEFVHIKQGKCIREYREYGGEVETDEGDTPEFEHCMDVAKFVDEEMLSYIE